MSVATDVPHPPRSPLRTRILCHNVDHTHTHLKRSKSAQIDVEAVETRSVSPNDSASELVIPRLGRVRSMKIMLPLGETLPATSRFCSPAPLLQHPKITGFPQNPISRLPRDFFGRQVPSIRSLIWNDMLLSPTPLPFSSLIRQPYAFEPPALLRAPLGLISSTPLLDSLYHLELISGTALSRVLPHFKVPRLEELSLLLPSDIEAPTIADLLPSDSYPLLTEVTSMDFYTVHKESRLNLSAFATEVTIVTYPCTSPTDNFFSTISFSLAQIIGLVLGVTAKSIATRISEFTSLERLELQRCEEEAEVLSDLSPFPGPGSLVPCPHLVAVKVAFSDPTTQVVDRLKQMVRSRKEAGSPLTTVKLACFDGMDEILGIGERNEWVGQAPVLSRSHFNSLSPGWDTLTSYLARTILVDACCQNSLKRHVLQYDGKNTT